MQEFYTHLFEDRRPHSPFRICVTLSQLPTMVALVAPRKPCFFDSRRSAVVSVSRRIDRQIGVADFNGDLGPVDLGERVARASGRSAIMSGALAMSLA